MVISRTSALPLYHQLRQFIQDKIESGEWERGHQLPGEGDLQAEFGVSRATVRQALQLLQNDGLIERIQGKGTFVGRPKVVSNLAAMFLSQGLIRAPGSSTGSRLLYVKQTSAPPSAATRLHLAQGEPVYEVQRTIVIDDEHLMLITSWLPCALVPGLDRSGLAETSWRDVLRGDYNLEVVKQHKEVEVTILDQEEADILGGHAGAPAMLFTYLNLLRDGTPLEDRKMIVRGDRCKYYMDLDTPELIL